MLEIAEQERRFTSRRAARGDMPQLVIFEIESECAARSLRFRVSMLADSRFDEFEIVIHQRSGLC